MMIIDHKKSYIRPILSTYTRKNALYGMPVTIDNI